MWSVIPSCINGVAVIAREKEIKGWRRSKKIKLIESTNPHWHDLPADWQNVYKSKLTSTAREIPRPAGESAGLRGDAPEMVKAADGHGGRQGCADNHALPTLQ
jgi:hypothetical protein